MKWKDLCYHGLMINIKKMSPSFSIIQTKALNLHEDWKTQLTEDSNMEFRASKGWLDKFKIRNSLHNVKFIGETADADKDAAN